MEFSSGWQSYSGTLREIWREQIAAVVGQGLAQPVRSTALEEIGYARLTRQEAQDTGREGRGPVSDADRRLARRAVRGLDEKFERLEPGAVPAAKVSGKIEETGEEYVQTDLFDTPKKGVPARRKPRGPRDIFPARSLSRRAAIKDAEKRFGVHDKNSEAGQIDFGTDSPIVRCLPRFRVHSRNTLL